MLGLIHIVDSPPVLVHLTVLGDPENNFHQLLKAKLIIVEPATLLCFKNLK